MQLNKMSCARQIGTVLMAALLLVSLAACNLQRKQDDGAPSGGPTGAVQPAVVETGQPANAPTEAVIDGAPTAAPEVVVTTPDADPQGDEVDQDLQELEGLNNSADPMDDEP